MKHHVALATPCCAAGWIDRPKNGPHSCARCGHEYPRNANKGFFLAEGKLEAWLEQDFDPLTATLLATIIQDRLWMAHQVFRTVDDWHQRERFLRSITGVLMDLPDPVR